MTRLAGIAVWKLTMTVGLILVVAGCTSPQVSAPPARIPAPARPAVNPFQAKVAGRAFRMRLTPEDISRSLPKSSGTAVISIAAARDRVCWHISRLSGVPDPQFAYIHRAGTGDSGPVVVPLGSKYQPAGCVTGVAPGLLSAIEAHPRGYYLAIHNRIHPLGAVRGWL